MAVSGPDKLTIVSIGTGGYRDRLDAASLGRMKNITIALHALRTIIDDSSGLVLALMQWLGTSPTPWRVNSEIGDLAEQFPSGPLFRFLRYDVRLEAGWLREQLDLKLGAKDLTRVREMDNPDSIPLAYEIGCVAAERQVRAEHWDQNRAAGASPTL
jgi:hypothetical protein